MRRITLQYPAPVALLLLAAVLGGCAAPDDSGSTAVSSVAKTPQAGSTGLALSVSSNQQAKCAWPINPDELSHSSLAFEGIVVSTSGSTATLQVTRTFRGKPGDQVQVSGDLPEGLFGSPDFVRGRAFLLTGEDGAIDSCASGPADVLALRDSYQHAFQDIPAPPKAGATGLVLDESGADRAQCARPTAKDWKDATFASLAFEGSVTKVSVGADLRERAGLRTGA